MPKQQPNTAIRDLRLGDREHELAATVALIRSEVIPAAHLGSLIDEAGSAVRLVQLSEADRLFAATEASHAIIGVVTDADVSRALAETGRWKEQGRDVRTVLDESYPHELHEIFNRPPLVFVKGHWPAINERPLIAVVGTRKPSSDGARRAARIATELVEAGFGILSGLASGIDTEAHRAALKAGGTTSAVMGTGIDKLFPADNEGLAEEIVAKGGALVSQFFPDAPPARWTFPMRNVVMSGLSMATVVVEAGATSGARMQARIALQHGRTVFLLQSLVQSHDWAATYVSEGAYGTRAIEISTTDDIVSRLALRGGINARVAVA